MARVSEIPASEVRAQISDVISRVAFGGERVVISRNGKAQAAVIPIADLDRLKQLDEQREARRKRAAAAVSAIRDAADRAGTAALSEDEVGAEIDDTRKTRKRAGSKARR